jgi:hypothetical protein
MVSTLRSFVWGIAVTGLLALLAASPMQAQSAPIKDALGFPGPIAFEGKTYALAWAAQPSTGYHKQEYLPAGQQVGRHTDMFIVEAITGGVTIQNAVAAQIAKLKQRKGKDPVANYEVIRNNATGEIILDFLMSDRSQGALVVEWNAYRYTKLDGGVALFAISRRGYGEEAKPFLAGLKNWRSNTMNALAQFAAPNITQVK